MDAPTGTTPTTPRVDYGAKWVYCRKPRCPSCGASGATTTRSIDTGDDSRTQRKKCKVCGETFTVFWE